MNDNSKQEKTRKDILPFILIFLAATVCCIVFSALCFYGSLRPFFVKYAFWLTIAAAIVLSTVCGVGIWFTIKGRGVFYKTLFSVYLFTLFCLVVCFILQKTGFFNIIKDADSLQEYLQTSGAWMPAFYILLQYLQVVVLPIPSIVSTVAGLALFGPFWTTIFSLLGIILGSVTAFFVGRKLGYKAVAWMVGEEALQKWQTKLKGKDNLVLTVMFMLPLFPDDILCFLAGLSSMSFTYFIVMMTIARVLAISATCYSIDLIPFDTWWGLLIWGVFIAILVFAFIWIYKNLDKIQKKITELKSKKNK